MTVSFGSLATQMQDHRAKAVVRNIMQVTPITDYIDVVDTGGSFTHFWNRDATIPSGTFTGLNQSAPTPSQGGQRRMTSTVCRLSYKMRIDEAIRDHPTMWETEEAKQLRLAGISMGLDLTEYFFDSDDTANPLQPKGLRQILDEGITDATLSANQRVNAGTGGATLTLSMLDQLIDAVIGDKKVLFMNRTLRRKILALVRDASASGFYRINMTADSFGRPVEMYGNIPIRVIERTDNYATSLDFDEDDGSGNLDTARIWCINFDPDMGVYIFATKGLGMKVDPFVKVPGEHYYDSLSSQMFNTVMAGVRSAAALIHLNNA